MELEDGKIAIHYRRARDLAKSDRFLAKRPKQEAPHFTCVTYSADGERILAGGSGRFVCCYQVQQQVLVAKFRVSHRRDDEEDSDDEGVMERVKGSGANTRTTTTTTSRRLPGSTT